MGVDLKKILPLAVLLGFNVVGGGLEFSGGLGLGLRVQGLGMNLERVGDG